jgi:hypothetical protein
MGVQISFTPDQLNFGPVRPGSTGPDISVDPSLGRRASALMARQGVWVSRWNNSIEMKRLDGRGHSRRVERRPRSA